MSDSANRLINTLSGLGKDTVSGISYGIVKSTNPLIITREVGSSRNDLTSEFLVLSKLCKIMTISTAAHDHKTNDVVSDKALQSLQLWPGLSVGEQVILISFNDNQKFFVERI